MKHSETVVSRSGQSREDGEPQAPAERPVLTDQQLLLEYATTQSEDAFAAIVARHAGFVYSAALRQTGNQTAADEITQAVFVILARKASGFGQETVLSGWLFRAVRYAAMDFRKVEARRRIFTSDAKLMLPGFETITGRDAIQRFWQAGLAGGIVEGIAFAPAELTEGDSLVAETGTLSMLDMDGKAKDQSRYLLVWKQEEGEWRIHRDIANADRAPAPKIDRVGFPKDYRTTFKVLGIRTSTNVAPSIVMTAYGNDMAAAVTNAGQLPYSNGSVLLMEFTEVLKGSDGKPLFDANGRLQKGVVQHVDVMRRGEGFGEAYGPNRSGLWEFAGYHTDGTYATAPAKSASCAQCHQKAGGATDFVYPLGATAEAAR